MQITDVFYRDQMVCYSAQNMAWELDLTPEIMATVSRTEILPVGEFSFLAGGPDADTYEHTFHPEPGELTLEELEGLAHRFHAQAFKRGVYVF